MTSRRRFLLGAAAIGVSMMAGLSPALAIGGDDPIPGVDIIIKKNPGSKPINPYSLTGSEIKMLNGLKGADRPAFVLKTVAKHIGEDGEFVASGMKALGDIWCGPCKMVNDISVKFPVGEATYMLDLHIHGKGSAPSKSLSDAMKRD
ncbi:hypothetical protein [Celeribacter halophilus]|uniref:Tat (Twin-arginine translocation) pathway signal sequence n=1 Tax=Celeribacter halophilus TaxID=576117 RepID=A0A1I3MS32_9RHOB|nr:hypothetical protein [Celeribacter halophilus]PZX15497.1 hypothetical protein LX82_00128 [Celeribacter halophilus]SFI99828.1 hypothetical protein SAMN04488138_101128 [Celeribacter halophilus]